MIEEAKESESTLLLVIVQRLNHIEEEIEQNPNVDPGEMIQKEKIRDYLQMRHDQEQKASAKSKKKLVKNSLEESKDEVVPVAGVQGQ